MKILSAILLLFVLDSPAPITLTPDESKAVTDVMITRDQLAKKLEAATTAALNSPLKCEDAISALSNFQTLTALKIAADSNAMSLLNAHRLAHNCADCLYDGKFLTLVKPEKKPEKP